MILTCRWTRTASRSVSLRVKSVMKLHSAIGLLAVVLSPLGHADVLEGRWIKLPKACGNSGEMQCGGDEITIKGNFLWWQNCKRTAFKVVSTTTTTTILDVSDKTPCFWHKQKVAVFKLETRNSRLSLHGYKAMPPVEHNSLFSGYGYEKD